MSAFMLCPVHINLMAIGAVDGLSDGVTLTKPKHTAAKLAKLLADQNRRSICEHYRDEPDTQADRKAFAKRYAYADPIHRPTAAEMYSLIRCYTYQACETYDWQGTPVCELCDQWTADIERQVPAARRYAASRNSVGRTWQEMEELPWSWTPVNVAMAFAGRRADGKALLAGLSGRTVGADDIAWLTFADWLDDCGFGRMRLADFNGRQPVFLCDLNRLAVA